MITSSGKKKIGLALLCLGLVIWGLTDVRKRAHFDPVRAAEDRAVIMEHRTDLTVFTEAGAAFFDERDPYEITNPRGWMYLYPPLFAILIAPLHSLPPQWQGVVWYFLSLAMVWGCYRETVRLLRQAGAAEFGQDARKTFRWIQIAAVAAILFPTLDCLQRGQVGILILYLLLLGLRLILERDTWLKTAVGGMILSLSIVFKIIPALPVFFLLFLFLVQRLRKPEPFSRSFKFLGVGVLSGLCLFFFVVPSMFIGWQSNTAFLKTWSQVIGNQAVETSVEAHFSNPRSLRNQSLGNALYHVGNRVAYWFSMDTEPHPWDHRDNRDRYMDSPDAIKGVLVVRVLLVLLLIPVGWRMAVRGEAMDVLAAFGLACTAMLIASPVSRGHYFMLEWPAVLFVSLWVWKMAGSKKALLCVGIPAALSLIHYGFIALPQIFGQLPSNILFLGTLGIGTALWYGGVACGMTVAPVSKVKTDA